MNQTAKEVVALFFSMLIILVIETGALMISWNYFLHEIFNSDKITLFQSLLILLVY